eukprot:CAMPEP_0170820386 /NCGR_PEP_ID=MMETSP0733-20121128/42254_1 /TAXON_ID=186038 /ORGANISM="Fragilariopsis kerguelensis, Strain L26-C5" /LENGTH=459 /DNA_ID=CAMNT_0011181587 /DNA_START=109 /DNA_END=1488 /DNA_ORIENTATION=-
MYYYCCWKRIHFGLILFYLQTSSIFGWLSSSLLSPLAPSQSYLSSKFHKSSTLLSPSITSSLTTTKLFESNINDENDNNNNHDDNNNDEASATPSTTPSSFVLVRNSDTNEIGEISESNNDDDTNDIENDAADLDEEEGEGNDVSCLPPGKSPEIKRIFLVSDATGVMSRSVLLKSLAQFDTCADERAPYETKRTKNKTTDTTLVPATGTCDVQIRTFTFVRSISALSQILQTAHQKKACMMYTIAEPKLRNHAGKECQQLCLPHVDLMGPSLDVFCLKADDGQAPWLLPEADIVLVGVSRSGKTPLSVVLSQTMSLKVANIPLVMEVPPPSQLLEEVDPKRVFCLTINPKELRRIRTNRLEKRGVTDLEEKSEKSKSVIVPKSNYADRNYILKDLSSVRKLCDKHQWTEVDVTGRAVEETATSIVELFNQRFLNGNDDGDGDEDEGSSSSSFSNQHIG